MDKPIFINKFQKASAENANIGFGAMVGTETYTQKGVARISRNTTNVGSGVVTGLVKYIAPATDQTIYAQDDNGIIYRSADEGQTWAVVTGNSLTAAHGNGIVFYAGFLFVFRNGAIDFLESPYTSSDWTNDWQTGLFSGFEDHYPFIYPSAYGFYFANGNKLGFVGQVGSTTFNPGGTINTDYLYTNNIFELPPIYQIKCIAFLPPSQLMLGLGSDSDSQVADIVGWDTISKNKFTPPLRLYSQASQGNNGVVAMINRNNTLYAITGGNNALFETNGTNFRQIADLSIYTTVRTSGGAQSTTPVFFAPYSKSLTVMGNKLFMGTTTSQQSLFPVNYGAFPLGVWSVAFLEDSEPIQLEYPISTGTVRSDQQFRIGAVYPTTKNRLLIGWRDSGAFGLDLVSTDQFRTNATVILESEMFEIGTALNPTTIENVEIELVRLLETNQTISIYWRTRFDQDFTILETFTGDGTTNAYKITSNPIGATQFIQWRATMATTVSLNTHTPELRTIIMS